MAVKVCSKCGESNAESAFLCVGCGHTLKDAAVEGISNADKAAFSKAYPTICSHCNERLEPNSIKCKYCGTVLTKKQTVAHYDSYTSDNNGCATLLLFAATFLIPIVGLIVGGIFAFSEDPNKQDVGKALLIFGLIMIVVIIFIRFMFA